MSKLALTMACGPYDRMEALGQGVVQPEGIDLRYLGIQSPPEIFARMIKTNSFDVAEMSLAHYCIMRARGDFPFVALPVFPSRVFRHGFIFINKNAGIRGPKDLEGKRVGVQEYRQTAGVWQRGILQHEYGVDFEKIHWVQGAVNHAGSHGDPHVLPLLKPMAIEHAPGGKSLNALIEEGVVDATLGTSLPESVRTNPNIARLFPDYVELEKDYYKRTGIFPIMHLIAIKRDLYERYPFIATSLYNAFVKSKRIALRNMYNLRALRYMTPWLMRDIDEIWDVFNGDPWPYGVEPNRKTLEALVTYLKDQHLIAEKPRVNDLFVPSYGEVDSWY